MSNKKWASWLLAGGLALGLGVSVMAAPMLRGAVEQQLPTARLNPSAVDGRLLLDNTAPRVAAEAPSRPKTVTSAAKGSAQKSDFVAFSNGALDYTISFPAGYEVASNTGYEVQALYGKDGKETAYFIVQAGESAGELVTSMKEIMNNSIVQAAGFSKDARTTSQWISQNGEDAAFLMQISQKTLGFKQKTAYFYCSGVELEEGRTLFTWALSPQKDFEQQKVETSVVAASFQRN